MERRPRGPGLAYAAVTLVLVILVGALALSVRQPPPPTIAEFAPQALENITDAPSDQGTGPGGGKGGRESAADVKQPGQITSAPIEVPRVRRCVGDPPRQTEDPQSPPCVPYWAGDNGGATAKGVTRDEIRIAFPVIFDDAANVQKIADHINRRYELYGRKLKLVQFQSRWGVFGGSPAALRADAVDVDEKYRSFGSLGMLGGGEIKNNYYEELVRRNILAIDSEPTPMLTAQFDRSDPYLWQLFSPLDAWQASVGSWMCATLKDRPPVYAGADVLATAPKRVFGLIRGRTSSWDETFPEVAPLRAALGRCGQSFKLMRDSYNDTQADANAMVAMRQASVTSIICMCDGGNLLSALMPSASGQGYQPEWLIQSYHYQEREDTAQLFPSDQIVHGFGLSFYNKFNPPPDMPWYWAIKESDPNPSFASNRYLFLYSRYMQLLMLATGLQNAGPNLTAQSFGEGLRRTKFSNPGCGAPPYYQACVGVAPGTHSLIHDSAMIWWSPSERGFMGSQSNQPGAFCYVDRGRRAGPDWTAQDPSYFKGPCR